MEQLKNLNKFPLKLAHGATWGLCIVYVDGHINDWLFIRVNIAFENFVESSDFDQSSDFSIWPNIVFED